MQAVGYILFIVGGFVMGSFLFGEIVPKLFLKKDIYSISADGNPGTANVFSNCGAGWGILCLTLELLKGFIPVFLCLKILGTDNLLFSLVLIAPVLGAAIGLFNHFRGGKCIAVIFGTMIALLPVSRIGLILAAIFVGFAIFSKFNSNKTMSIFVYSIFMAVAAVYLILFARYAILIGCEIQSIIAIVKHSVSEN